MRSLNINVWRILWQSGMGSFANLPAVKPSGRELNAKLTRYGCYASASSSSAATANSHCNANELQPMQLHNGAHKHA